MRGLAVLLVLIYHAWSEVLPKGFLGVDVFFVVSGFLIGLLLLTEMEAGTFSFQKFYLRRARRLLPASISTIFGTALVALVVLTNSQLREFSEQLIGALFFGANFVLASQTGYFEGSAETKPLLHIWSLSLEEQFYFVAPFALWISPPRFRPWLLVGGFALSSALCLVLLSGPTWIPFTASGAQKLAFFMLPSRAWELLAGSLCAWTMLRRPELAVHRNIKLVAVAAILLVSTTGFDAVHPRLDALIVVLSTSVILLGKDDWLKQSFLTRPVAKIGDWSYSLYLIHWPLLSFAFIAYGGRAPSVVTGALCVLAVLLAWAQFTFVEQPFRQGNLRGRRTAWFLISGAAAVLSSAAVAVLMAPAGKIDLRPHQGLNPACDQKLQKWRDIPACRTSAAPLVAVWGDSYAMHLVPGLTDLPLVQLTRSACAPIMGIANVGPDYPVSWARGCIDFNESALEWIEESGSIQFVIISSPFSQVLLNRGQSLLVDNTLNSWNHLGEIRLAATLRRLKAAGKTPILIGPTPSASFDAGVCNERALERRVVLGRDSCDINIGEARTRDAGMAALLQKVAAEAGVEVLSPWTVLCRSGVCLTGSKSAVYYQDGGHLTPTGARLVIEGLGLKSRLTGLNPSLTDASRDSN
ncbi:COG1835 Predicted acyltransferases [Caulobacteraceae bacterium]